MAGFAGARRPHPGRHTVTPAVLRYALAVSLRTPVACSMRRKGHPSFPSAITCCFFSSLKTLLIPREPIRAPLGVNVPGSSLAGFQLTLIGRIWVTPEGESKFLIYDALKKSKPIAADDEIAVYAGSQIPEIDVDKLVYFALSVFWRSAVHR